MTVLEAVLEPTAAQRLAVARDGLQRLLAEQAAVQARRAAAQADFGALDALLMDLYRQADIRGVDVAQDATALEAQRTGAARAVSAASLAADDLTRRAAAVRAALPALEAAALQDELLAAVEDGKAQALRYRAALEAFLETALALQNALTGCERLSGGIVAKGGEPRIRLFAPLVAGAAIDHVLRVARDTGGDQQAVRRAMANLFEKWLL